MGAAECGPRCKVTGPWTCKASWRLQGPTLLHLLQGRPGGFPKCCWDSVLTHPGGQNWGKARCLAPEYQRSIGKSTLTRTNQGFRNYLGYPRPQEQIWALWLRKRFFQTACSPFLAPGENWGDLPISKSCEDTRLPCLQNANHSCSVALKVPPDPLKLIPVTSSMEQQTQHPYWNNAVSPGCSESDPTPC